MKYLPHALAVIAIGIAVAAHVPDELGFDDLRTDVTENTEAIDRLDDTASQAADTRAQFAAETPAEGCDAVLDALDRLRYVGGEPVTPEPEDRLRIVTDLVTAIGGCSGDGS